MKKSNILFLLLLSGIAFTSSCEDTSPKDTKAGPSTEQATIPKETEKPESKAEKPEPDFLIENKVLHAFSNPGKKDEFRIVITGESLLKGKVLFTITSWEGTNLLTEEFDADYLLGYDFTGNIDSKKETDAFIRKRIKEFFSEDRFSTPAIEDEVVFEDQGYYIDQETWEEIKADRKAIGFFYLLGKEDGRHLAFSKKKGKVVMYYNCC